MSKGINLLPTQTKTTAVIVTKLQIVRGIAIIILFGVSFLSLGLSILIAFSPLPKLKTTENELGAYMNALHPKIAKQMVLTERITSVDILMKKRQRHDALIEMLQTAIPSPSRIDELKITATEVVVRFSSSSLASIDVIIGNIKKVNDEKKQFRKITIDSVYFNYDTGSYTATLQMLLQV